MMKKLVYLIDEKVNLIAILFLFWALFWGLNGGDKFFNGQQVANIESWSAKSVLVDTNGDITYTLHPVQTVGLYGVNRDAKMINFFKGIYLPKELALTALYGIAVAELVLGLTFLALLIWYLSPEKLKAKTGRMFADRTIHRLALKGSILIFVFFCIGDILFGDRLELWEHSSFIVLCLITYNMWYRADQFFIEKESENYVTGLVDLTST
jgi:hypothetical protein